MGEIVKVVCLSLCFLAMTIFSKEFAPNPEWQYKPDKLLSTISVSVTLKDTDRSKDLPVRVTAPKVKSKNPVIIWSHGAFGSKDGYDPLVKFWAESGYVVVQPTHSDSLALMSVEERRKALGYLAQGKFPPGIFKNWRERALDIKFVLDSLDKLSEIVPELSGCIDATKIGVGGHSYGAFTTQVIAGATVRTLSGERISLSDKRPIAFVAISPSGPDGLFDTKSFSEINRPMLLITGSNDFGRGGQTALWRRRAYELLPEGDKFLLWIEGAYHDFGGISGLTRATRRWFAPKFMGDENQKHLEIVRSATLAFWDAYLKGDERAKEFLKARKIERAGGVTLNAK
ncbi:MAG: hypothetical protein N3B10_13755 [Armatimonadetes bacterium]|nr:hypothetical protein [Armatimonadota bacterium]MCX7969534.1 hypothetical protein [Armatimonadota bacterium]MDW8143297.1 hypothetical protein [Armatimonadota bacterium]